MIYLIYYMSTTMYDNSNQILKALNTSITFNPILTTIILSLVAINCLYVIVRIVFNKGEF